MKYSVIHIRYPYLVIVVIILINIIIIFFIIYHSHHHERLHRRFSANYSCVWILCRFSIQIEYLGCDSWPSDRRVLLLNGGLRGRGQSIPVTELSVSGVRIKVQKMIFSLIFVAKFLTGAER